MSMFSSYERRKQVSFLLHFTFSCIIEDLNCRKHFEKRKEVSTVWFQASEKDPLWREVLGWLLCEWLVRLLQANFPSS